MLKILLPVILLAAAPADGALLTGDEVQSFLTAHRMALNVAIPEVKGQRFHEAYRFSLYVSQSADFSPQVRAQIIESVIFHGIGFGGISTTTHANTLENQSALLTLATLGALTQQHGITLNTDEAQKNTHISTALSYVGYGVQLKQYEAASAEEKAVQLGEVGPALRLIQETYSDLSYQFSALSLDSIRFIEFLPRKVSSTPPTSLLSRSRASSSSEGCLPSTPGASSIHSENSACSPVEEDEAVPSEQDLALALQSLWPSEDGEVVYNDEEEPQALPHQGVDGHADGDAAVALGHQSSVGGMGTVSTDVPMVPIKEKTEPETSSSSDSSWGPAWMQKGASTLGWILPPVCLYLSQMLAGDVVSQELPMDGYNNATMCLNPHLLGGGAGPYPGAAFWNS